MTVTRLLARPMMASMFVVGGVNALKNSEQAAQRAKPVTDKMTATAKKMAPQAPIPTDELTLVRINAAAQITAAIAHTGPADLPPSSKATSPIPKLMMPTMSL